MMKIIELNLLAREGVGGEALRLHGKLRYHSTGLGTENNHEKRQGPKTRTARVSMVDVILPSKHQQSKNTLALTLREPQSH